jgi:hypothetical protein
MRTRIVPTVTLGLLDGVSALRKSFKGDTSQSPYIYIALTLARRRDDPPSQDFVHDGGLLAWVIQCLAGSVERLAHDLGGGVIKNTARNKWNYRRQRKHSHVPRVPDWD